MPVDFVASAMDHIAHLDDSELPGETFHLVNPEAMTVGQAMIEFAKAAHAPQMVMRIDPKVPKAIPKSVRAGFKAVPIVKRVRAQVLRDIGVPAAVLETRDFRCTFDARDTQRALKGTGIAVPAAVDLRAAAVGLLGAEHGPGPVPRPEPVATPSKASAS